MTAVGLRELAAFDPVQDARIPAWIAYPADAATEPQRFGPYAIDAARDAEVVGRDLPLVVISHGTGSSPWLFRGLASYLAVRGIAALLVEHPGNSRNDDRLAHTVANLENRPRHVRYALDAALADPRLGAALSPTAIAIVGHSLGGYTALAVAGGHAVTLPFDRPDGRPHPIATERDPRIRAAVLLAPAIGWFGADGALAEVDLPLLVRTGGRDELSPAARTTWILRSLPETAHLDFLDVPGAGHFSFMSPFPAEMTRPELPPSQDPPGFDRAGYQPILHGEIDGFVRRALALT